MRLRAAAGAGGEGGGTWPGQAGPLARTPQIPGEHANLYLGAPLLGGFCKRKAAAGNAVAEAGRRVTCAKCWWCAPCAIRGRVGPPFPLPRLESNPETLMSVPDHPLRSPTALDRLGRSVSATGSMAGLLRLVARSPVAWGSAAVAGAVTLALVSLRKVWAMLGSLPIGVCPRCRCPRPPPLPPVSRLLPTTAPATTAGLLHKKPSYNQRA